MSHSALALVSTRLFGRFRSRSEIRESRKSSGSEQGGNMSRSFSM